MFFVLLSEFQSNECKEMLIKAGPDSFKCQFTRCINNKYFVESWSSSRAYL